MLTLYLFDYFTEVLQIASKGILIGVSCRKKLPVFSVFSVLSHPCIVHLIVLVYFKGVFWVAGCFLLFIEGAYVMQ